jgi:acetoin utilization deacetylase AcuC-like enzyme
VHPRDYVERLEAAVPAQGLARIDADTALSSGSWEPILRAAGGATHAVDQVVQGKARNAFIAMRPPGHHAETATPMGFCFINNAAIAARYAQKKHGVGRVAIVDFDVHHGNGSQEIFWADPTVMYCSTHEMPLYPGTGAKSERGGRQHVPYRKRRQPPFRAAVEQKSYRTSIASTGVHHRFGLRRPRAIAGR